MKGSFNGRQIDWQRKAYESLANAVIERAVKDYRKALTILRRHPADPEMRAMRWDCEEFFRSRRFGMLSATDGRKIMADIQREIFGPKGKAQRGERRDKPYAGRGGTEEPDACCQLGEDDRQSI